MNHIRSFFDTECAHLKFDKVLAKKIADYNTSFVNKNEEHMAFFGGHLTGTHVVRFASSDRDHWFEMLEIDDVLLDEKLEKLPSINVDWVVSSDLLNQTCCWLAHRFLTSPLMHDADKEEAAVQVLLFMNITFLTSRMTHYFRYQADPEIAEATYARLSNKYLLKQFGNWYATLRARSVDIIHGIHKHTLISYNDDSSIVYLINDSQGRIRDMIKNICGVFIETNTAGIRIKTSSSILELDGEAILKDRVKSLQGYNRYLHSIITDKNSFIKEELLDVVSRVQHTMPPKLLTQSLEWCCHNYRYAGNNDIENLIDKTLVHSFGYLSDNQTLLKHSVDLPGLISRLRGVYMSSRSTDPELIELRNIAERIVRNATSTKNDSVIASVRTGLLLYVVLRAYTSRHYTSTSAQGF